jgi:osmotically-inducible protein OsmY
VLPRERALDDRTVEQRIRSDVLRSVGLGRKDVDVRVEQGVVTLRGQVAGRTLADDLIGRVQSVPGVVEVAAMLRVSAEAA